jgi:hypothetical protein
MSRRNRASRRAARKERLRDGGPDPSGNYDVNPYAARGHVVEVAPKELRSNPNSQQFPKRIATQRVIDRYRAHNHITDREWRAANELWEFHCEAGRIASMASSYDPVMVQASPGNDGRLASYLDAALRFTRLMRAVDYHCQGVVRTVVIEDLPASEWARGRGYRHHDAERHGLDRLRAGLQGLAAHLGG